MQGPVREKSRRTQDCNVEWVSNWFIIYYFDFQNEFSFHIHDFSFFLSWLTLDILQNLERTWTPQRPLFLSFLSFLPCLPGAFEVCQIYPTETIQHLIEGYIVSYKRDTRLKIGGSYYFWSHYIINYYVFASYCSVLRLLHISCIHSPKKDHGEVNG